MTSDRPWDVEVEVSAATAAALVRSQFPSIPAADCSIIGQGWDNTAVLIDGELVFRFPHRASAVSQLNTEIRVLPHLQPHLPLRIPEPEWIGRPDASFPWPFAGYRRIPGRLASDVRLSRPTRQELAPVLAGFMASLHALPPAGLDLPGDTLRRTDIASRMPLIDQRLHALHRSGCIPSPSPWLGLFRDVPAARAGQDAIVHGDLYARHFVVDDALRLNGVIDWGDVHGGDVAVDLMAVYEFLPSGARRAFLAAYGPVGDDVLERARLRAAFHAISLAWYASETSDEDLLVEAKEALEFVLED